MNQWRTQDFSDSKKCIKKNILRIIYIIFLTLVIDILPGYPLLKTNKYFTVRHWLFHIYPKF